MIGKIRVSENDEVLSVYGTLQDMSKQKEKEALESMYEQLERTVNFKSDFLAQMSLEIRTPLNGIVGAIENMDSGVEKEESEKLFSIIKDSSFDLLHIVNNVLKLSKLEAGQEKAEFVDCETENLVKSTIKLFESKANAEDTTLKLAIDNNVPSMLRIDMPRVKQVLNNLISNAIKYTKKGEVKLSVSQEEINNTDCVRFTVSDNGEGMNQNELDKIFFK
ncbi:HAMP domain-containing histidine kinase [Flavobacteriales bacterium]|nr:HAMP domain-containing histidine kinase [Flavobacteriales bacterium]